MNKKILGVFMLFILGLTSFAIAGTYEGDGSYSLSKGDSVILDNGYKLILTEVKTFVMGSTNMGAKYSFDVYKEDDKLTNISFNSYNFDDSDYSIEVLGESIAEITFSAGMNPDKSQVTITSLGVSKEKGNLDSQNTDNQGMREPVGENIASQNQEMVQTRVQDGSHMGEGGEMFRIQTKSKNQFNIQSGGVEAKCTECNLSQEMVGEMVRLKAELSNGQNSEIKVMPDKASETALERLRLRTCSEENNCSIELKEVGKNEGAKMAYELKTERSSRVLGMFKTKMNVRAQVDAETGEVLKVKKPWWAFLASEPAEE